MRYFTASGRFVPDSSLAGSWGAWMVYIEVADDQLAVRQIDRFANGNLLCYDWDHSRDEYGYLTGVRFSRKPKWRKFYPDAVMISSVQFDAEWKKSRNSPSCVNRSRS